MPKDVFYKNPEKQKNVLFFGVPGKVLEVENKRNRRRMEKAADVEIGRCFYCGLIATDREHMNPITFGKSGSKKNIRKMQFRGQSDNILPSCRECNSLASDKVFSDKYEKRSFIQGRISSRYKKILKSPDWTDEELEEMSPKFQKNIKLMMAVKRIIRNRIIWPAQNYDEKMDDKDIFSLLTKYLQED